MGKSVKNFSKLNLLGIDTKQFLVRLLNLKYKVFHFYVFHAVEYLGSLHLWY